MNTFRMLASVSDKTGLTDLVTGLKKIFGNGLMVLSTGGTAKKLKEESLPVMDVASFTGSPEVMGGRVKTLHPKIFGGILARRNDPADMDEMTNVLKSAEISLVVVNLYPFAKAADNRNTPFDELIEQIDIGGPSLLRAAAKNFRDVLVVADPTDYPRLLEELRCEGGPTLQFRLELMRKAFRHTANYDARIAIEMEKHTAIWEGKVSRVHLDQISRTLNDRS